MNLLQVKQNKALNTNEDISGKSAKNDEKTSKNGQFSAKNDQFSDEKTEILQKNDLNLDEIRAILSEKKAKIEHFERLFKRTNNDDIAEALLVLQKEYSELERQQGITIANTRKGKKYYSEALKMNFIFDEEERKAFFEDGVVYTEKEMRDLHTKGEKPLKGIELIHTMKKLYGKGKGIVLDGWVGA